MRGQATSIKSESIRTQILRQVQLQTTNNEHALSDKLPTYLQPLLHIRSARPSTASTGLGSDVSNDLSITLNTWKLPDISSLHNVMQNRHQARMSRCKLLFLSRISVFHQACSFNTNQNGGAERDRTADPLLAKQVLSQLSYSPNPSRSPDGKPTGIGKPSQQPNGQSRKGKARQPIVSAARPERSDRIRQLRHNILQREWWARVDSNYRPHAYQACALTN